MKKLIFVLFTIILFACQKEDVTRRDYLVGQDPKTVTNTLYLFRQGSPLTQQPGILVYGDNLALYTLEPPKTDSPFNAHPLHYLCLPKTTFQFIKAGPDYRLPYQYFQLKRNGVIAGYIMKGGWISMCKNRSIMIGVAMEDLNGDGLNDVVDGSIAMQILYNATTSTGTLIIY